MGASLSVALGVAPERVRTVDPYRLPALSKALREEIGIPEPSVIIAERPCTLSDFHVRQPPYRVDAERCNGCGSDAALHEHRRLGLHGLRGVRRLLRAEGHSAARSASPRRGGARTSGARRSADIIVCGIGGQGVMTAADLLTRAAIDCGYDCTKSEIAGMAQRGGAVTSQVRIAERVYSPVIGPGGADIVHAFELAEALRWVDHLRRGGVVIVNTLRIPPPVVSSGLHEYPGDPLAVLRAARVELHDLDAGAIACDIGDARLANSVMLEAVSGFLPFSPDTLETALIERFRARRPALLESNRRGFAAGAAAIATSQ